MPYQLAYSISFGDMVADEEDYIEYLNRIQTFVNTSLRPYLLLQTPSVFPAFDEEIHEYTYLIEAQFPDSDHLYAALSLLQGFCVLNKLLEDTRADIRSC